MNHEEIRKNTIELCAQIFQNSGVDIDMLEFVDFTDDLGMDSITFITLIVEIEAMFDIVIPDDLLLMDNFKSVDDVIRVISEQLIESTSKKDGNCYD